eukprot:TRINITY_DN4191_c0_g1_i4.p1 TRINITY_DN4191_c0_g1~~TRINITY_DN4191_c0_g1_i4.p1  ORF type:complete len:487 (-),score=52.76 TRINITY_DN4191_c0_g1_i4:449-1789(-)
MADSLSFFKAVVSLCVFLSFSCDCAKRPPLLSPHGNSHNLFRDSSAEAAAFYQTKYFTQILDHFSFRPSSYKDFQQKYLVDDRHWGGPAKRSPIFVHTGSEASIELLANNSGLMFDMAPKFQALLVFIEHRFYGDSMPFGSEEKAYKDAKTLGYLNSQQALADFATLLVDLKKNLSAEACPVIAFGGSYGGMLAAWMRLKYPHVVAGALASSAPILYFDNIVQPKAFFDVVSLDFKKTSRSCFHAIKNCYRKLQLMSDTENALERISQTFQSCKRLKSIDTVRDWLDEAFTDSAMREYPTASDSLTQLPAYPVKQMCKIIDSFPRGTDVISRVFAGASIYYNNSNSENKHCFDLERPNSQTPNGWNWQACTEMVMPMSASPESMFTPCTFNYTDYANRCKRNTGVVPRPHWITTEFGGHNISSVLKHFASNIIFSNGLRDPWSSGG